MKWAFGLRKALMVLALSASSPSFATDYTLYNVVPMALDHEAEQAAREAEASAEAAEGAEQADQ